MTRKIIASVLLVCMIGSMSLYAADSIDALSYEDRQAYLSQALSVQTKEHTTVTVDTYDWGRPGGWVSSYGEGETSAEWYPYLGARQISKADFFQLAGYPELAASEKKIADTQKSMAIAKWSLVGAGSLLMLIGLPLLYAGVDTESNDAMAATGGVMSLVGLAAFIPAVILEFTPPESDISISFAVNVASGYNQKLLESFNGIQ